MTDDCEAYPPRKREGTAVADRYPGGPDGTPGTRVPVSRGDWQAQTSGYVRYHLHPGPREAAGAD